VNVHNHVKSSGTDTDRKVYCTKPPVFVHSSLEKHWPGMHSGTRPSHAATDMAADIDRDGAVGHEVAVEGGEGGRGIRCGHSCDC